MAAITPTEKERLQLRSVTSWKRVTISTSIAMLLAFVSVTFSDIHFVWTAFSVVMGIFAAIAFLFAFTSVAVTFYYEIWAQFDYGSSQLYKSDLPLDRFVVRDALQ